VGNDPSASARSLKPFTAFGCGAKDQGTDTNLQFCWKYQLDEDAVFWEKGETG